jgi:P27 family predicted phage terminase small subunit
MGKRGPVPKPAGLRLLEGTDRKGRSGRVLDRTRMPVAPSGDLEAPHELTEEAREVWDAVVEDLKALQVDSPADRLLVGVLVQQVVIWRRATRELESARLLVDGARGGLVVNRLILVQRDASTQITRLCDRFGLNPAARMSVERNSVAGAGSSGGKGAARKPNPFAG